MPSSPHSMFRNSVEFIKAEDRKKAFPPKTRGIYVLYMESIKNGKNEMKVVYVGMSRAEDSGILGRLDRHYKAKSKINCWTHFSVFEVWPNIPAQQVQELEGLFRHISRCDNDAIKLGKQKTHAPLKAINRKSAKAWIRDSNGMV